MTTRLPYLDLAPMPAPGDHDRIRTLALDAATALVTRVRDDDPHMVWRSLQCFTPTELLAIAITLAAMVPDYCTPRELLAWTETLEVAE